MNRSLLLKGFEVELFTGRFNGENVGVASSLTQQLEGFVKEPDHRNIEYITNPQTEYLPLNKELLLPRKILREWLAPQGLTLLPGSTLSLGNSNKFERSDLTNTYHDFIEDTYGTRVVTASIHINLGITDLSLLFSALRLIRVEAALCLALSASSPFLDGKTTGAHSQRWLQFPHTPKRVPLFLNHGHYVKWVEAQLAAGIMLNERHLWTSVRPNGPKRPYDLNRIELRICDLIPDVELLLAVTAFIELRVLSLFQNLHKLDPLKASSLSAIELAELSDRNDREVAKMSLDATLHHWKDGSKILCRDWIHELLLELKPLAIDMNLIQKLSSITSLVEKGNISMQWLTLYLEGNSVQEVIQKSITDMEFDEETLRNSEALLG